MNYCHFYSNGKHNALDTTSEILVTIEISSTKTSKKITSLLESIVWLKKGPSEFSCLPLNEILLFISEIEHIYHFAINTNYLVSYW